MIKMKLIKHLKRYWVFIITQKIRIVIFHVNSSNYECLDYFPKKDRGFHKIRSAKNLPSCGLRLILKKWVMELIWK